MPTATSAKAITCCPTTAPRSGNCYHSVTRFAHSACFLKTDLRSCSHRLSVREEISTSMSATSQVATHASFMRARSDSSPAHGNPMAKSLSSMKYAAKMATMCTSLICLLENCRRYFSQRFPRGIATMRGCLTAAVFTWRPTRIVNTPRWHSIPWKTKSSGSWRRRTLISAT